MLRKVAQRAPPLLHSPPRGKKPSPRGGKRPSNRHLAVFTPPGFDQAREPIYLAPHGGATNPPGAASAPRAKALTREQKRLTARFRPPLDTGLTPGEVRAISADGGSGSSPTITVAVLPGRWWNDT